MKILTAGRGKGKTFELIKRSHDSWLYIVCSTKERVQHIAKTAQDLKIDIPYPISVRELPIRSPHIKEVLVDDLEDLVQYVIGKDVCLATTSCDVLNMEDYRQEFSIVSPDNFAPSILMRFLLTGDEYIEFIKLFTSSIRIDDDNLIFENKSSKLISYLKDWSNIIQKDVAKKGKTILERYAGYLIIDNTVYTIIPDYEYTKENIRILRKTIGND